MKIKELRRRLEVQGFLGLSDQELHEVGPWTKFTPWLNTVFIAIGTFLGSQKILLALALLMALGSILPLHPFDWLYNYTIRFLTHTRPLPPSGPRRRFVFSLGCWWLLITAWLFTKGHYAAAFVMGCVMTAIALLLAMSNICVVSEFLNWAFGSPAKPSKS